MLSESIPNNGQASLRAVPTHRPTSDERAPATQTTMRVGKRNGESEPVDVNKIVRAVSRSCQGLSEVDAMRVATKTISGLYDGATTRELDKLSIQTAAGLIVEEPQYARLAARLLATYIDKEVRNQGIHAFSQSIATAHKLGLVNARLAGVRHPQRAEAERRDRRRSRPRVRVLRPAHGLRPVPAEAPEDPARRRDSAAVLPSHRLRPLRDGARRARALRPLLAARVFAQLTDDVQFGHQARAALELLLARLARRSPGEHLPALHRRRPALEVLRRHRARLPPRALARVAHREHERPLQRDRILAQDARRLGVGGESGRQAQGRLLRLPRTMARGRRGVPRAP